MDSPEDVLLHFDPTDVTRLHAELLRQVKEAYLQEALKIKAKMDRRIKEMFDERREAFGQTLESRKRLHRQYRSLLEELNKDMDKALEGLPEALKRCDEGC